MNTMILAVVAMAASGISNAPVPAGADAIDGSFARMVAHEPTALAPAPAGQTAADASDFQFEQWVNGVARGEMSSLERGFASMLERADDVPAALTVRGEPDEVDQLVAEALRPQAACVLRHAAL
jgi:hypothetical protein